MTTSASYGILQRNQIQSDLDLAVEEIRTQGFAVIDAGFDDNQVQCIQRMFDQTRVAYLAKHGEKFLQERDEHNTVRLPLLIDPGFRQLAINANVLQVVSQLISGTYLLNQQNAIVNPAGRGYNQDAWHRDLPYQHFISSTPLAINALYCVDDFTQDNGATHVVPASHKQGPFSSEGYLKKHAIQVEAKAGSFIVLDCMTFHRGGENRTQYDRRAINHMYTIPFFRQQIEIPACLTATSLSEQELRLLGFHQRSIPSVDAYLASRKK